MLVTASLFFPCTGPHPENNYSYAGYAKILDLVRSKLQVDQFILVRHSMGGWLSEYTMPRSMIERERAVDHVAGEVLPAFGIVGPRMSAVVHCKARGSEAIID